MQLKYILNVIQFAKALCTIIKCYFLLTKHCFPVFDPLLRHSNADPLLPLCSHFQSVFTAVIAAWHFSGRFS